MIVKRTPVPNVTTDKHKDISNVILSFVRYIEGNGGIWDAHVYMATDENDTSGSITSSAAGMRNSLNLPDHLSKFNDADEQLDALARLEFDPFVRRGEVFPLPSAINSIYKASDTFKIWLTNHFSRRKKSHILLSGRFYCAGLSNTPETYLKEALSLSKHGHHLRRNVCEFCFMILHFKRIAIETNDLPAGTIAKKMAPAIFPNEYEESPGKAVSSLQRIICMLPTAECMKYTQPLDLNGGIPTCMLTCIHQMRLNCREGIEMFQGGIGVVYREQVKNAIHKHRMARGGYISENCDAIVRRPARVLLFWMRITRIQIMQHDTYSKLLPIASPTIERDEAREIIQKTISGMNHLPTEVEQRNVLCFIILNARQLIRFSKTPSKATRSRFLPVSAVEITVDNISRLLGPRLFNKNIFKLWCDEVRPIKKALATVKTEEERIEINNAEHAATEKLMSDARRVLRCLLENVPNSFYARYASFTGPMDVPKPSVFKSILFTLDRLLLA